MVMVAACTAQQELQSPPSVIGVRPCCGFRAKGRTGEGLLVGVLLAWLTPCPPSSAVLPCLACALARSAAAELVLLGGFTTACPAPPETQVGQRLLLWHLGGVASYNSGGLVGKVGQAMGL